MRHRRAVRVASQPLGKIMAHRPRSESEPPRGKSAHGYSRSAKALFSETVKANGGMDVGAEQPDPNGERLLVAPDVRADGRHHSGQLFW
jgi:hypothetical protein